MNVRLEYISWPAMDVLEDGTHPFTDGGSKVYYCYYEPTGKEESWYIIFFTVRLKVPVQICDIILHAVFLLSLLTMVKY